VAGLTPDQLRLAVWFFLAGTIFGFSISTLWEWLYYRRKRVRVVESSRYALTETPVLATQYALAPPEPPPGGALLDSERDADSRSELPAAPPPAEGPRPGAPPSAIAAGTAAAALAAGAARGPAPTRVSDVDAAHAARSRGYPDDLTQIAGVTRGYQQRLYAASIYTWHQVATSDAHVLAEVTGASEDARVERWPASARTLAERHGRVNAAYSGPPPDDLTRIRGIHAEEAQALYRAGITSYRQLADTPERELAALFPEGDAEGHDYAAWRRVAQALARPAAAPPSAAHNGAADEGTVTT
jgi:predicted flap endonuclease-1-like 5' DNA nuclease